LDFYREITSRYQSGDFVVVTYTPRADLLSDQSLETLQSLRDELLEVPGVQASLSILDVPLLYSPPVTLSEVTSGEEFRKLTTPGVDREQALEEFQTSPLYRDTLVS